VARASAKQLSLCTAASVALGVALGPRAWAQQPSLPQIEAIQKQIRGLQQELLQLKRDLAARNGQARAARIEATQAREAAQQAVEAAQHPALINPFPPPPPPGPPPGAVAVAPGSPEAYATARGGLSPHPVFQVGAVRVSLGGWVELDSIFRSRNTVGDLNSSWVSIPLNNVAAGHESEYRMSARRSRLAALVEGFPDEVSAVRAYLEADFLGAAPTANSNQSNSYNPRMRQYYATYDRNDWGFHLLFGQAWSLSTQTKIGIVPREENVPITIDQGYMPGFVYTRTPQIRLTQDLYHKKLWLGVSLENPQTTFVVGPNGTGLPTGTSVNFNNPGASQLNPLTSYSNDVAPDLTVKVALDPGFGHYELFALGKMIKTRTDTIGAGTNKVVFGGGIGGSFIVPLLPGGNLQLQGSALAGKGIGRYGVGQLPDTTIGPNGQALPIPEVDALIGVIGRPIPTVDIYSYIGTERETSRAFSVDGKGFGYGSPLYSNAGCSVELSPLPCTGNTAALTGGVIGGWWRFLHGNFGTMMAGASYSYVRKNVFQGIGGSPYANEQIFMASFRYYPFE
jgi:hypothetical protein